MKSTSRNTVVLVAFVAIAVVVSLSFLVGRGLGAASPSGTPSTTPTSTTPQAPSWTPSASNTGSLGRGAAVAVGGGTKTGPGGVVMGYPQTEQGAVSAATNYWAMAYNAAIGDPKVAQQLAEAISDPDRLDYVESTLSKWSEINAPPRQVTAHPTWGAYAVKGFYDDEASIYLWWPHTYVDPTNPTPGTLLLEGIHWEVVSVNVTWVDGDWKWSNYQPPTVSTNVAPVAPTSPPSPQEKYEILHRPNPSQELLDYQSLLWLEYADAA